MPPAERSHPDTLRLPLHRLPDPLPIPVAHAPFDAVISPPGSKSIANRALLLAALAPGTSTLSNLPAGADDVRVMIDALRTLGARIDVSPGPLDAPGRPPAHAVARVLGVGGHWRIDPGATARLHLAGAGTAVRFLAAAVLLAPPGASIEIDGDDRMRQRPLADLALALESLGVRCQWLGRPGSVPLRLTAPAPRRAGEPLTAALAAAPSSQFISALMLVAPFLNAPLCISAPARPPSTPYIHMTAALLARLGAEPRISIPAADAADASARIDLRPAHIAPFNLTIEPDASAASTFFAAAALIPRARITIPGLDLHPARPPLQGDARFIAVPAAMGAAAERLDNALRLTGPAILHPFDVDFTDTPDTAMNAAALACFADGPSTLRGLRTLRLKESDRLAALQTELARTGAAVSIDAIRGDETLRITPPSPSPAAHRAPVVFQTYNDHRMAMALALIGLRRPGVSIANPACVAKSYPSFWCDLADALQSTR
ncbi:MAG: 3-phosphoshikimate 1-carboxyvinyltransferase [Phycisphaeraceae bacterium]|nr:3-phosphoshikimate 1-carboxyvinyltransferase [Phycisphaeraceae bacterium]